MDLVRFKMLMKLFKKSRFHLLFWGAMFSYLLLAPGLFAVFFTQGKPLDTDNGLPVESQEITLVVDGVKTSFRDGQSLWELYGWAYLLPESPMDAGSFERDIVLTSDEEIYFFSTEPVALKPKKPEYFTDRGVQLETLGFRAPILIQAIKPGRYRIGIVFRNESTGAAYYCDKPKYYLIKSPNTISMED